MPDRSALYSAYFKAEDFKESGSRILTIKEEVEENTAREGEPANRRSVLYVEEDDRGIVLNKTRYAEVSEILGSKNTDNWIGAKLAFSFDPDVKFGGRKVGGISVSAPK